MFEYGVVIKKLWDISKIDSRSLGAVSATMTISIKKITIRSRIVDVLIIIYHFGLVEIM